MCDSDTLGNPVLVTTVHRGVFFGYLQEDQGATVVLRNARNCVYWSSDVKGFLGLAAKGPSKTCRIGSKAPEITLRDVTAVVRCTDEAQAAWEAEPWA